jgi:hypothetical protein
MNIATKRALTYENDFAEFLTVRERGEIAEIDEEMFYYWLEVLPPKGFNGEQNGEAMTMIRMGGQWKRQDDSVQRFSFAFAEGYEPLTVFWQKDGRYFAQRTNILNSR